MKKRDYIKVNINYRLDSKEIENKRITPLKQVINRYYQKKKKIQ